jgi:predicted MPP superfamily phosphohydrolase
MVALVILFFVGGYAVLQAIVYHRVCAAFAPSWRQRLALAIWLVFVTFAPFWSRAFDHARMGRGAWWMGVIAYTWLILAFWFGCLSAAWWAWNGASYVCRRLLGFHKAPAISARRSVQISLAIVLLAALWGLVEAEHIRVNEIWVRSPLVPGSARPIRVAQISDLHLGKPRGARFARKVVARIRELRPDILVSTGDFIDASTLCEEGLGAIFRDVEAPLGKYAVLGNHEYYTGLAASLAFHDAAGFILLRGKAMAVTPWLALAGVDDPAAHYTGQGGVTDEREALKDTRQGQMVILLKHQPRVSSVAPLNVDLQLSGHTHGGQFFPFNWFVRLLYPYAPGMHRISDRMLLYVSRGTGAWGSPIRFLAPPEITVFVFVPPA